VVNLGSPDTNDVRKFALTELEHLMHLTIEIVAQSGFNELCTGETVSIQVDILTISCVSYTCSDSIWFLLNQLANSGSIEKTSATGASTRRRISPISSTEHFHPTD
jgi:hypothetical protein